MEKPPVVVTEDKTAIKLAGIAGAVAALWLTWPILLIVFFIFALITGVLFMVGGLGLITSLFTNPNGAALLFGALFLVSLAPALRDRLSGKFNARKLEARVRELELELSAANLELVQMQDFEKLKLNVSEKQKNQLH